MTDPHDPDAFLTELEEQRAEREALHRAPPPPPPAPRASDTAPVPAGPVRRGVFIPGSGWLPIVNEHDA